MDSDNGRVKTSSAASSARASEEDRRVEELLQVNARLAAEVRRLALGRAAAPRSEHPTTSRRLAVLIDERDTLAERQQATEHALEVSEVHRGELERANFELGRDLHRLRAGPRGLLRRAFARLLRA